MEEEAGTGKGVGSGRGATGRHRSREAFLLSILPHRALRSDYPIFCCNSGKVCAAVNTGQEIQRHGFSSYLTTNYLCP